LVGPNHRNYFENANARSKRMWQLSFHFWQKWPLLSIKLNTYTRVYTTSFTYSATFSYMNIKNLFWWFFCVFPLQTNAYASIIIIIPDSVSVWRHPIVNFTNILWAVFFDKKMSCTVFFYLHFGFGNILEEYCQKNCS